MSSDSQYPIDDVSPATSSPDDEINSLPDSAPSDDIDDDEDEEESDAEKEWKESLQQLELILTMVLVPYVGKYFGRKCAYWGEPTIPGGDNQIGQPRERRLTREQAGRDSWSGSTLSRWSSQARRCSMQLVP